MPAKSAIAKEGGEVSKPVLPMGNFHQIEAEADTVVSIPTITSYLSQLAALCREVSRRPELLPLFIAIIMLVPGTIARLGRERKRLAA
jgi:hypothetical protein